jgi:hypothetical protein
MFIELTEESLGRAIPPPPLMLSPQSSDLEGVRSIRAAGAFTAALFVVAGCGGGTAVVAGKADAAAACKTSGVQAAALAAKAAAVNPTYAMLSADEGALAATQANQQTELSESTDDSGLVGVTTLTTPAGMKVVTDCTALGLPVPH